MVASLSVPGPPTYFFGAGGVAQGSRVYEVRETSFSGTTSPH